jgi:hypothetical protein
LHRKSLVCKCKLSVRPKRQQQQQQHKQQQDKQQHEQQQASWHLRQQRYVMRLYLHALQLTVAHLQLGLVERELLVAHAKAAVSCHLSFTHVPDTCDDITKMVIALWAQHRTAQHQQ